MKAEDIDPRLNYVVIRHIEASEKTPGGIVMPEAVKKKANITVEIVKVGPGTWGEHGDRIPMELKAGDHALMHPSAMFFEVPGMPGIAITADDAIVARVPKTLAEMGEYDRTIITA